MKKQWTAKDVPNQTGKRAIVTGANSGVGFQTARELARAGAEVVLACRSRERGEAAAVKIRAEQPGARVEVRMLDLSSLASVRAFAEAELAEGKALDILVNNAGIMMPPKREVSEDGFELQMATNYLGHFALTGLLMPLLLRAGAARVVSLSSNAHKRGRLYLDDLQQERGYSDYRSYAQTKLAMLAYAKHLQRQSEAHGARLLSAAAHPGFATTSITRKVQGPPKYVIPMVMSLLGQDDRQGALPQLYAATEAQVQPGGYYGPGGFGEFKGYPAPAKAAPQAEDAASAARLWALSEQATGVVYRWDASR